MANRLTPNTVAQAYFRKQDTSLWAVKWGIIRSPEATFTFSDYLDAAIAEGRSKSNVFAARVMWPTMAELAEHLATLYPDVSGEDIDFLNRAFGPTRFIHLKRLDVVAQAVSRLRAEQTDVWHISDEAGYSAAVREPQYDFERIQGFIHEADEHHAAWEDWFRRNGLEPHVVFYEELDRDPAETVRGILNFLGIPLTEGSRFSASTHRLADALNNEWIKRYCWETTTRFPCTPR